MTRTCRQVDYVSGLSVLLTAFAGLLAWNLDYPVNMAFVLPGVVIWVILVVWVRQLLEARREQIAFETTTE